MRMARSRSTSSVQLLAIRIYTRRWLSMFRSWRSWARFENKTICIGLRVTCTFLYAYANIFHQLLFIIFDLTGFFFSYIHIYIIYCILFVLSLSLSLYIHIYTILFLFLLLSSCERQGEQNIYTAVTRFNAPTNNITFSKRKTKHTHKKKHDFLKSCISKS